MVHQCTASCYSLVQNYMFCNNRQDKSHKRHSVKTALWQTCFKKTKLKTWIRVITSILYWKHQYWSGLPLHWENCYITQNMNIKWFHR